jgi:hypothetical protein
MKFPMRWILCLQPTERQYSQLYNVSDMGVQLPVQPALPCATYFKLGQHHVLSIVVFSSSALLLLGQEPALLIAVKQKYTFVVYTIYM